LLYWNSGTKKTSVGDTSHRRATQTQTDTLITGYCHYCRIKFFVEWKEIKLQVSAGCSTFHVKVNWPLKSSTRSFFCNM